MLHQGGIINSIWLVIDSASTCTVAITSNITANTETDCDKYSVTDEVTSYFIIFECGRNLLNRLDVMYEQACMATTKDKYF